MPDVSTSSPPAPAPPHGGGESENKSTLLVVIGCFKLLKAVLMLAIAAGAFHLLHRNLAEAAKSLSHYLHQDPHNRFMRGLISKSTGITDAELKAFGVASLVYATIFLIEGIGLIRRKQWAEWMTVISGALLLPLEIYELIESLKPVRVGVFVLNLAVVVYLIVRLRGDAKRRKERPTP